MPSGLTFRKEIFRAQRETFAALDPHERFRSRFLRSTLLISSFLPLRFLRRCAPIIPRPAASNTNVDGSGTAPFTGALKVRVYVGSLALFASSPMQ